MRLLIYAYGGDGSDVDGAILDFDPRHLLTLMDRWQEFQAVVGDRLLDFRVWDYAPEWVSACDYDAISELQGNPFLEFEEIAFNGEVRTECDTVVVGQDSVYWSAIIKHTDMRIETELLTRDYVSQFVTAIDEMKEAIDEEGLDTGHDRGPDDRRAAAATEDGAHAAGPEGDRAR